MSGAHIHLIFNHFPLVGLIFSLLVLILGMLRNNESVIRVGFLIILVSALFTVPTYLSGEKAEDIIKQQPTFKEELVEEHEKAAFFVAWTVGLTAAAAAAGLYLSNKKKKTPKPVLICVVVLNLFTLTVVGRTNYLGGLISHPEIRE